jgi:hypothetical protein
MPADKSTSKRTLDRIRLMHKSTSMRYKEVTRISNNEQAEDKCILRYISGYYVHDVAI